jgi:hypothetical protein
METYSTIVTIVAILLYFKSRMQTEQLTSCIKIAKEIIAQKNDEIFSLTSRVKTKVKSQPKQIPQLDLDKQTIDLIRMANGQANIDEARNAAMKACQRLRKKI